MQRPPKIVSYNYFESGNETPTSGQQAADPHQHATNFALGHSLLSSNGEVEQLLSGAELEAIQKQFLTAEHPTVPLVGPSAPAPVHTQHSNSQYQANAEQNLASLINSFKSAGGHPSQIAPETLHQLGLSPQQGEELMREAASFTDQSAVALQKGELASASTQAERPGEPLNVASSEAIPVGRDHSRTQLPAMDTSATASLVGDKKKSLIVYLNHPRPDDMSKAANSNEDNLAQLISEQTSGDPFVSAKEFDSHGLSKETKHLDVSSLRGLGVEAKDVPDKDGLSVVVIGDAYKYKKIVLLISSKSGGLKFIPMVKDMKR